jgi:hypothetical protein
MEKYIPELLQRIWKTFLKSLGYREIIADEKLIKKERKIKLLSSTGNASKTKANESFDNGVFFYIKAKQTPSIVSKLFSKGSEHIQ